MCSSALLILRAPFVPARQYVQKHTAMTLQAGREHLDRVPGHPMEIEGDVSSGAYLLLQPLRIPEVPEELLALNLLCTSSLICCTERAPCRSTSVQVPCAGSLGSCWEPSPHSGRRAQSPGAAALAGRSCLCAAAWRSSCSLCLEADGSRQCSCGPCWGDLTGRTKPPAELPPPYQSAGGHKRWRSPATADREFPQVLQGSRCLPASESASFRCLLVRSCSFSGQVSQYVGHCFLWTCIFDFAQGRGELSLPVLPSWLSHESSNAVNLGCERSGSLS